jgi:hypothetical protein
VSLPAPSFYLWDMAATPTRARSAMLRITKEMIVMIDLYTKIVLTVIALCLTVLSVQSIRQVMPVSAQTTERVLILGAEQEAWKHPVPVKVLP